MTFKPPNYGIEISFIDNTIAEDQNGKQGPIADLTDGFMCDDLNPMIELCESMAQKLRDKRDRS